ncbi:MAG TPA: hypothetical protein VH478_10000, partial [Trebonia sp.]|nr:hypothetical protein [Trebonia sp.]
MHDQPSPESPRSRAVADASTILALSHLQSIAVQQGERAGRGRLEPSPTRPQPAVRQGRGRWRVPWPLLILLAVQAALSLRLIWANTAFLDEGTYVWAGRIELWNALRGTGVPDYATYFSGAPVIYPPLAGLADFLGGLTGTRLMSLGFMLGATTALWGTTRRLYGQRAALSAVALFVFIGSTQYLGALATYDAMALFLLTVSAWLVVVARDHDDS